MGKKVSCPMCGFRVRMEAEEGEAQESPEPKPMSLEDVRKRLRRGLTTERYSERELTWELRGELHTVTRVRPQSDGYQVVHWTYDGSPWERSYKASADELLEDFDRRWGELTLRHTYVVA